MIEAFQEDGVGSIYVVNGIGPMLRWDGYAASFETAGMDPPATALVISGSGAGPIVGDYYAFERFVDALENVSNLSPISVVYSPAGLTGTITNATNASPISVTSAAHGLATGATVKITGVGGNTSANNTFTITVVNANTFTLDDSHGTAAYDGGGTWVSGVSSLSFTSVPVPLEAKVVRRQILRNTDGQADTFYVDVDSTDLLTTTFTSTRSDADLATQEAVPLLDSERNLFANRHDKPLSYFPFIAFHLSRMFQCGSVEYTRGHVKATNGSATVYGVGTEWKSSMSARFLYVTGATRPYEILSINETLQTLTLTSAYIDLTDKFAFYAIKPPPAYQDLVVYSEAGLPQSWPALNALSVQQTGDQFTGLAVQGSFVFILKTRHIHKLTFSVGPLTDGGVFMAASRGCVNNRCWISADDALYMMDELGAYSFSQRSVQPLSAQIQSLFRLQPAQRFAEFKINWKRKEFFHANLDRQQSTIRWFLCLDGSRYPKYALCYHYGQQKWWIEIFPFSVGGTCNGEISESPQAFYGGTNSKVFAAWQGSVDVADPSLGTVQGTATGSALLSLSDSAASFDSSAVNSPVVIVQGKGKGQVRKIVEVTATELTIQNPWSILPDTTSVYQIGGVHWKYRTGWMRFARAEESTPRTLELSWEPIENPAVASLRFALDTIDNFDVQAIDQDSASGGGIQSIKDEADLIVDLTFEPGIARHTMPGHRETHIRGRRYVQFELEGFSNQDPIAVYQWIFEGVTVDSTPPQQQ